MVEKEKIGTGITRPTKLELAHDGETMKAAFKVEHSQELGLTQIPGCRPELNFSDSYLYERAAYLLDRELGLNMVPVAALRTIDGVEGAVVEWISGAIDEKERRARRALPDPPDVLFRQRFIMVIFDALIMNIDRNPGNQLITVSDWKLHLIDHSRAFRTRTELPEAIVIPPFRLPPSLLHRLEALEERHLDEKMDGLLSRRQIRSLLERRDKITAKVADDRKRFGDDVVFLPEP